TGPLPRCRPPARSRGSSPCAPCCGTGRARRQAPPRRKWSCDAPCRPVYRRQRPRASLRTCGGVCASLIMGLSAIREPSTMNLLSQRTRLRQLATPATVALVVAALCWLAFQSPPLEEFDCVARAEPGEREAVLKEVTRTCPPELRPE